MKLTDLKEGYFNVLEPITDNMVTNFDNCVSITPGICFDKNNYRVGYGKGFYDRYFQKAETMGNSLVKCGIAYDMQICDGIEADPYDRHLDMIVTENRIIR